MNELIEKLLDEAELDIVWNQDNPDYKWVEGSEESLLKFAELIVRECIGCCEQVISDPVPKSVDTCLNGGSQCIDQIKEHFGVEE